MCQGGTQGCLSSCGPGQTERVLTPEKYLYQTGNDNGEKLEAKVKVKVWQQESQRCSSLIGESQTEVAIGPEKYLYTTGNDNDIDLKEKVKSKVTTPIVSSF